MSRSRSLLSLSLSLLLIVVATVPAEAVKVILEKEIQLDEDGNPEGFREFNPRTLEALHFDTIAEYGYFLAGEVAEGDLASFQRGAEERQLFYEIRRDFDLIQINGYTFSSFGQPTGLPEDLVLTEYEGDVGMYLVQFKAPMTTTWWRALKAAGEVVSYYPQNTYLIRAAKGEMPVLRLVNGVQHVSLFQPAYKVRRSLLTRDEVVVVDVEFDGDQDLDTATAAIRGILDEDVSTDRIGRFVYSRLRAALGNRATILRRPEVTWVEPALQIEFGGERNATTMSGKHNGLAPERFTPDGHHGWLRSKGFCTPTVADEDCMIYWTKVGVVDTGLDRTVCLQYSEATGECSDWDDDNLLHPDLNHASNSTAACEAALGELEWDNHCDEPVIRETFFCAHDVAGNNQCEDDGEYIFTDSAFNSHGHGTAVTSLIVGDPLSMASGDPDPDEPDTGDYDGKDHAGFYRGTGIAPSSQIIVAKYGILASGNPVQGGMSTPKYTNLVGKINNAGARFVNNSWNLYLDDEQHPTYAGLYGWEYTLFSKVADRLVRDGDGTFDHNLSPMTLVFSAGNIREQDTETWVRSPGNAKNVISAGASMAWTAALQPTHQQCDDNAQTDIHGIADFSRRGYVHESTSSGASGPRFKPDLVAPGSMQIAAARTRNSDPVTELYRCFGGTSAAAPQVTASAVLAEAWYYYKITDEEIPSPAMIRAMLVAHADDLHGGKDHIQDPPVDLGHSPSLPQGWGRVNLDNLFQTEEPIRDVVVYDQDHRSYPLDQWDPEPERRFTPTVQSWHVALKVDDASEKVVIVMVYTDRFAEPGADPLTVNDLNLRVNQLGANPSDSRTYWGNYFDTDGYSKKTTGPMSGTPYDHVNTVEMIRIEAGELQSWPFRVTVTGAQISMIAVPGLDNNDPNQDFALYVYNAEISSGG